MAGLLDIFGTSGTGALSLLGGGDIEQARNDAQAQALYALAGRLFQGGGTGQSIAEGLQMGQQAYKQAMQGELSDRLTQFQLQEFKRKREEELASKLRAEQARKALMGAYVPPQAGTPELPPTTYGYEDVAVPGTYGVEWRAATPARYDLSKVAPALMSGAYGPEGLQTLSTVAKLVPELRKAGAFAESGGENPFAIFANDITLPETLRNVATQYATSFQKGLIDPEKVDERIRQLGDASQRASTSAENLEFRKQQAQFAQDLANQNIELRKILGQSSQDIQRQMLDLRRQAEANKPEQFSYSQKKEFDVVESLKEDARKAATNATIAQSAAPLIDQAYTGKVEAGIKGVAGAVGISTEAKVANDRLAQLSNQLAVNAPKFSGPTSDRDAARYDAAVGDLSNPNKTPESKRQALKDIKELSRKAEQYATQAENYYYNNNKSLRGFKFQANPYDGM